MRIVDMITRDRWEIGFVEGGLPAVMGVAPLQIQWLKHDYRDRWFADPFVLEVSEDEIQVLAEEVQYETEKGRIVLLKVDRKTYELRSLNLVLELQTHLSFPAIWREEGRVFVYPESWKSGELSLYEFKDGHCDPNSKTVICEESMADAVMTERFGKRQLFSVRDNDKLLVYNYNYEKQRFTISHVKFFNKATARNAGDFFEFEGEVYRPAQVCINRYGEAIEIQKVVRGDDDNFCFIPYKTLCSNHASLDVGMHTLNCYKGVVAVDVRGWNHALTVKSILAIKKLFLGWEHKK